MFACKNTILLILKAKQMEKREVAQCWLCGPDKIKIKPTQKNSLTFCEISSFVFLLRVKCSD